MQQRRQTIFSIGHGYSARALARELSRKNWDIIATTRSAEKARELRASGIEAYLWPGTPLSSLIERASHILSSVSPSTIIGDPVLKEARSALQQASGKLKWVGYLSTTAVYGDHQGNWVDEETPPNPGTARGVARLAAENAWRALPIPIHIFRLAGIYGPARGPFAKLRAGKAARIIKEGQVFSRIHVDDIAQILVRSMEMPTPNTIFNLCDDFPAPPQDVIAYAARILGRPLPEEVDFEQAQLSEMARSFYAENKRVRNERIKSILNIKLRHSDYRSGLDAILAAENSETAPENR